MNKSSVYIGTFASIVISILITIYVIKSFVDFTLKLIGAQ